jgi:hypothetical protein
MLVALIPAGDAAGLAAVRARHRIAAAAPPDGRFGAPDPAQTGRTSKPKSMPLRRAKSP